MLLKKEGVYIIAELSANHGGDIEIAKETIRAAKRIGADAIKLQTYTPDTMTLDVKRDEFLLKDTIWKGYYLHDLYKEAYTPWEWHKELFETAKEEGIDCFSTPFDLSSVDFLEQFNPPAYKIASFEITDIPLIEYVASKNRPIIFSIGIATLEDIELAISTCHKMGNKNISILKCTSSYPAPIEKSNLTMIRDIVEKFNVTSGLSDHTEGIIAPVVAVAMGAKIIEKHFILSKDIKSADASFSLDEIEFSEMIQAVKNAEKTIGIVDYSIDESKEKSRKLSRSIFVSSDVKEGDILSADNIKVVRPSVGLAPIHYNEILGKKFAGEYSKGTPLTLEMFE